MKCCMLLLLKTSQTECQKYYKIHVYICEEPSPHVLLTNQIYWNETVILLQQAQDDDAGDLKF